MESCIRCGAVPPSSQMQFVNERFTQEGTWAETGEHTSYLLCEECADTIADRLAGAALGTPGSDFDPSPHPGPRVQRSAKGCGFCASSLASDSVVAGLIPIERKRVAHRRYKVRGRASHYRLCRACALWVRARAYGRNGTLSLRSSENTRGSWMFTCVLDVVAVDLSDQDAAVLERTVKAMGGRFSTDAAAALRAPGAAVAFFVGTSGGTKATRFVESLPPELQNRVALVARWDTLQDLKGALLAGAADFVASPLTPQSVAGGIDRIASPVAGTAHPTGLKVLTDTTPRYGWARHALKIEDRRGSDTLGNAFLVRLGIRGYDVVGVNQTGITVATYCESRHLEEVRRRLEFLLGRGYKIAVESTAADVRQESPIVEGHLVQDRSGQVVGVGVRGLPDPGPRRPGELRVLYVEDTLYSLRLLEDAFRMVGGIQLLTATSGERGLAVARGGDVDLVLLDLHLPDIGGEEVLATMKADPALAGIPVIALTADATDATRQRVLAAGAAGYVTKPIDLRALLQTVRGYAAAA